MATDKGTVQALLADALAAVEGAKIPEDLRLTAFTKAVDLLAGTAAPTEPKPPGGGNDDKGNPTDDERMARVAQRTGADAAKLPYVYDLDDDDVNVVIQRSKLASSDASATRELTLLYCAARQAIGLDTQTPINLIRQHVENMGVYDSKNFTTHLKTIDGITVKKGQGNAREYKVTQHGFEEAGKLITRLTGGGS